MIEVDRVRGIPAGLFKSEYLMPSKPLVIEGFFSGETTSDQNLRNSLTTIRHRSEGPYFNAQKLTASYPIEQLKKTASLDVKTAVISKVFSEVEGSFSEFHMDIGHNFLVNYEGVKKMILYPNNSFFFLYPKIKFLKNRYSFASRIQSEDLFDVDIAKRFPLLKYAQRYETQLKPGDVLFIPSYMWHFAYYETSCISVANWWLDIWQNLKSNPLCLALSMPMLYRNKFFQEILK